MAEEPKACPGCGGEIVHREAKHGRIMYDCGSWWHAGYLSRSRACIVKERDQLQAEHAALRRQLAELVPEWREYARISDVPGRSNAYLACACALEKVRHRPHG
jgi:ssDNA-binding Zn-finger/Zn-ribbon topoisomerase 1